MSASGTGFKLSRTAITRRDGPLTALPEQGDAERLGRLSNSLKELGKDRGAYAQEIQKLWREVSERFLTIGRYLNRAKTVLEHGQFDAMVAADLPFGRQVAWQLRKIAVAVDEGVLLEEEVPRSYTTAYKVVEMKPEVLARAKRENLVRPNLTRSEVNSFLRRIAEERMAAQSPSERLLQEKAALEVRLRALTEEQRVARRRIAEIDNELAEVAKSAASTSNR